MIKIYDTLEEAVFWYRNYIDIHVLGVHEAHINFTDILIDMLVEDGKIQADLKSKKIMFINVSRNINTHDLSKYSEFEFDQYRAKFYPCKEDNMSKEEIAKNFNEAWIHHYRNNWHHPEYWYGLDTEFSINNRVDMEYTALIEMILDFLSMSFIRAQSFKDWWFNNPGGRQEKSKLLPEYHVSFIDKFIEKYDDNISSFTSSGETIAKRYGLKS